ncbi:MAG TPA: hypothetical protein VLD86_18740, partial [Ilumatobacteraceae bacterium]|nr:hypothetical protein [Ilumatobacteraceae bacterium]
AVDWSYELLFDAERTLLARLSVFAGGFDLAAVTAVCADDALAADDLDVLLARLVDKSLVATDRRPGHGARFRLLRPVAEYAADRLDEAGQTGPIRARHTRWLIDMTSGLTDGLRGPSKLTWAQLANTELANVARATDWGAADGNPVDALRLAVNLGWYAFLSANMQHDEPVMLELLDRATDAPPALKVKALMWSGLLSIGRTEHRTWAMDAIDVARTAASAGAPQMVTGIDGVGLTHRAIASARTTDDPALLLEALTIGSLHLAAVGSLPEELHELNHEARAIAGALDDNWSSAMVTGLEGVATYVAGDLELSMAQLRAAIDALRDLGDDGTACLFEVSFSEVAELRGDIAVATDAMAQALTLGTAAGFRSAIVLRAVLCWLTGRSGEVQRALELGREVVTLAHQPFNPVIRGQALFALGVAETLAGLHEEAASHLDEALQIHQQVGMVRETAMDHRHLGSLLHLRGDAAAATRHHAQAIRLAVDVGLPWTVMLAARSMAETIVDADAELACRLLGNAEAVSHLFGYWPTPDEQSLVDDTMAIATDRLGGAAVCRARAAGAAMSYTELPNLLTA